MAMNRYITTLKGASVVARDTMAFVLKRPEGFLFIPGQHIDVELINPEKTDAEGAIRTFSIASAAIEPDLMVATRMRDTAFKNVIRTLPPGAEIMIDGPYGDMILQSNTERPAVFLAGGIGIAPFRSIAVEAARKKLPHTIFLFYSNRAPEDAPFLNEMRELERENPRYRIICTMTGSNNGKTSWQGETGYITKEMILRYCSDIPSPVYYLAGPPEMVSAMHTMLLYTMGVSEDDIRIEEFSGY